MQYIIIIPQLGNITYRGYHGNGVYIYPLPKAIRRNRIMKTIFQQAAPNKEGQALTRIILTYCMQSTYDIFNVACNAAVVFTHFLTVADTVSSVEEK